MKNTLAAALAAIESLAQASKTAATPGDAVQNSQAALNLAQAVGILVASGLAG